MNIRRFWCWFNSILNVTQSNCNRFVFIQNGVLGIFNGYYEGECAAFTGGKNGISQFRSYQVLQFAFCIQRDILSSNVGVNGSVIHYSYRVANNWKKRIQPFRS